MQGDTAKQNLKTIGTCECWCGTHFKKSLLLKILHMSFPSPPPLTYFGTHSLYLLYEARKQFTNDFPIQVLAFLSFSCEIKSRILTCKLGFNICSASTQDPHKVKDSVLYNYVVILMGQLCLWWLSQHQLILQSF